jgi:hypothetical protein
VSHWLPEQWPKTVVSFDKPYKDEKGKLSFDVIGTGFMIQYKDLTCLVTARHVVVDDSGGLSKNTFVAFNLITGLVARVLLDDFEKIDSNWKWIFHPRKEVDLAILPFAVAKEMDLKSIGQDLFEKFQDIVEGDEIFFLGFPLGIMSEKKVSPLVRGGIVSLKREDQTFLIDAAVFPGNSGSPVFLKPSIIDFKTKHIGTETAAEFLGIISGYLPYIDDAISRQTGRKRISFEENSGLGVVYSANLVWEICESEGFQRSYGLLNSKFKDGSVAIRYLVKTPELV